jgi:hypothetical protein
MNRTSRQNDGALPIYLESEVTVGGGFVWTGNDDERNQSGSVSKIDPATNQVVGNLPSLGSPQSIAFGQGAVWVADHAGWLVKIDPARLKVIARRRLDFGPHGVVVAPHAVYVADAHGGRLLQADPGTARVERIAELSPGSIHPVVGAGSIWSSSAAAWGCNQRRPRHAHRSADPQGHADAASWRQRSFPHLRTWKRLGRGAHRVAHRAHLTCGVERPTD